MLARLSASVKIQPTRDSGPSTWQDFKNRTLKKTCRFELSPLIADNWELGSASSLLTLREVDSLEVFHERTDSFKMGQLRLGLPHIITSNSIKSIQHNTRIAISSMKNAIQWQHWQHWRLVHDQVRRNFKGSASN